MIMPPRGMPSITLSDRLIWFAHCPKAGGTSVEKFMVATWGDAVGHLHWGWDLWWRRGGWRVADPPNSPQHLTWQDARRVLPRSPDAIFAVVRDPVARMASEYRWQRQGRRGTWLGRALACLPFPLWLRVMLTVAQKNPYAFDNHFRPQSEFVPDTATVFRLEDGLGPPLGWLNRISGGGGEPGPPPHAIPTRQKLPVAASDAALIGQVFASDYVRFGYDRPRSAAPRPGLDGLAMALAPLVAKLDRRGAL